jgi:peptidoglycan/LPS O-acetylase OafA/YrhL
MALDGSRRNNFDLVRIVAVLHVLWVHCIAHLQPPFTDLTLVVNFLIRSFEGVPALFMVSGYLIGDTWLRDPTPARYARNRALRVYPGMWACFAGGLILLAAFDALAPLLANQASLALWLTTQLAGLPAYNPPELRGFGVGVLNGSLWTIPVEIQYYLLAPLLVRAPRRWLLVMAAGSAVAFGALESARPLPPALRLLQITLLPHMVCFVLGLLVRLERDRLAPLIEHRFVPWLAIYLAVQVALASLGVFDDPWAEAVTRPLLAGLVFSGAYSFRNASGTILRGHDISYGLYLWHMIVINALVELRLVGAWRWAGLAAVLSIVIAILSWLFVERPAMTLKRRGDQRPAVLPG